MKRRRRTVRRAVRKKQNGNGGLFLIIIIIIAAAVLLIKMKMPEKIDALKEKVIEKFGDKSSITESVAAFGRKIIGTDKRNTAENPNAETVSIQYRELPTEGVSGLMLWNLSQRALIFAENCSSYIKNDANTLFMYSQDEYMAAGYPETICLDKFPVEQSISRPASGPVISNFGYINSNKDKTVKFNYGIDISADTDGNVYAFADGKVILNAESAEFGLYTAIEHNNGMVTMYSNCSDIYVSAGDNVKSGDIIGKADRSVSVTDASFLHFELIKDGKYINPGYYI